MYVCVYVYVHLSFRNVILDYRWNLTIHCILELSGVVVFIERNALLRVLNIQVG